MNKYDVEASFCSGISNYVIFLWLKLKILILFILMYEKMLQYSSLGFVYCVTIIDEHTTFF